MISCLKNTTKFGKKLKITQPKKFGSEPVHNDKDLKAKVKSYSGKTNTNLHDNKIPKEGCQFVCLSAIFIDSVFITSKNYYPQVF